MASLGFSLRVTLATKSCADPQGTIECMKSVRQMKRELKEEGCSATNLLLKSTTPCLRLASAGALGDWIPDAEQNPTRATSSNESVTA